MGIFNTAFIETGGIHASPTAAAVQFSEHSPVFQQNSIARHPNYNSNHNHDQN